MTPTPLLLVQVRALCQNPNGGIPATFLSSQQSDTEAIAVKKELSKVGAGAGVNNGVFPGCQWGLPPLATHNSAEQPRLPGPEAELH